ncbi:MAG: TerB family tellurite resistance protein [Bdellovibrionales bacterium]|nr:TerB family tellurite resistance protein [Bdellovibrionales bacterium]
MKFSLLRNIFSFFKKKITQRANISSSTGTLAEDELLLAAAVILIDVAGADKDIHPKEAEEICRLLKKEFKVPEEKLPQLIEIAVEARDDEEVVEKLMHGICENFSKAQKKKLLAMVWRIIIIDEKIDVFEKKYVNNLKFRLRLDNVDAEEARNLAEKAKI